jgi:Mg-dependent DNase
VRLVDSHSHFDVDAFDVDRAEVFARARAAGVIAQIVPAIDAEGWPRLREVCAADDGLHAAYGLHPIYLDAHRPEHLAMLRERLEHDDCVAVGEIGLDYYLDPLDRDQQQQYFEAQLALAREFGLPVIVHARRAVDAVIATLRRFAPVRGVVHSFAGSEEQAAQLYKLGYLLGIGGPVTYERAQRLRRLVATMPIEHCCWNRFPRPARCPLARPTQRALAPADGAGCRRRAARRTPRSHCRRDHRQRRTPVRHHGSLKPHIGPSLSSA